MEKILSNVQASMVVFVNDEGDVFFRGVEQTELKGTLKPTSELTKEEKQERKEQYKDSIPAPQAPTKQPDDLLERLEKQEQMLAAQNEMINKLIKQSNTLGGDTQFIKVKDEPKFGAPQVRDMPKADQMDKPVTFFTPTRGGCFSVYYKNGQPSYAPYGKPLTFAYESTDRRGKGKDTELIHYSKFTTFSKLEADWLRNHDDYGRWIFESVSDVIKINKEAAVRMQNISNYVNSLTDGRLFAEAQRYGIFNANGNKQDMISKLLTIKYDEAIKEQTQIEEKRVRSMSVGLTKDDE
jgi:hypothetical protein